MTLAHLFMFITAAFTVQNARQLSAAGGTPDAEQFLRAAPAGITPLLLIANLCLVGGTVWQWWFETVYMTHLHQKGLAPATSVLFPARVSVLIALYLIGAALYALSQFVLTASAETVHRTQV